jgi:diguanylate cyclase (GGDEF)-like protein
MIAQLQQQVALAERYGTPLSISLIDVDNFKQINDTYGHPVGDQVLRYIASEMRDRIRQPDVIGRLGGDEFLVILPSSRASAAGEQARRLCQQIAGTPVIAGKEIINVGLSIGITQYQPDSDDWHSLLDRVDQAMYQAKRNGRGQWAILEA